MILSFQYNYKTFTFNSEVKFNLTQTVKREASSLAFFAPDAHFDPLKIGAFIGSLEAGGACNCEWVHVLPHCHGTHTETIKHILNDGPNISEIEIPTLMLADLVTVNPEIVGEDSIIKQINFPEKSAQALVIRVELVEATSFSGKNPPFFNAEVLNIAAQKGYQHLLVNLPSVDQEEDGGKLLAHKAWWSFPETPRTDCTITELLSIPDFVEDGVYLLNLQVPQIETDAVNSSVVIFPVKTQN
jgi:kynurenine formamidase